MGLLTALVAIATMVIKIPTPIGYVNIGDSMVFLSAILFGPVAGLLAGGLGSAIADILLGCAAWAPWTLAIKGLEGFLVGLLAHRSYHQASTNGWIVRLVLVCCLGGAIMVAGYWLSYGIMTGNLTAGTVEVPFNIVQAAVSVVLAVTVAAALKRSGITRRQQ